MPTVRLMMHHVGFLIENQRHPEGIRDFLREGDYDETTINHVFGIALDLLQHPERDIEILAGRDHANDSFCSRCAYLDGAICTKPVGGRIETNSLYAILYDLRPGTYSVRQLLGRKPPQHWHRW